MSVWTRTHPSAALLQTFAKLYEWLMYRSTLRFQMFLRLAYGQVFVQTQVCGPSQNKKRKNCDQRVWEKIS